MFVELLDQLRGMLEVGGRFPSGLMLTIPLHVVLELASFLWFPSGVKYLLNFPFKVTIDDNRRWWWLNLAREWIRSNRFQKGHMKDWVYLHGRRKFELIGMSTYSLQDLESTKSLIIKLLGRVLSPDVAGK